MEHRGDNPVVGWRHWINHRINHPVLSVSVALQRAVFLVAAATLMRQPNVLYCSTLSCLLSNGPPPVFAVT